jgi:Dolichyl-phosphate-mannose-protein mannosyltransferase
MDARACARLSKASTFIAWELTAWFAVFPISDWSYYLLATVNLGGGLFAAFLLAGEWLEVEKRAAVLFLLAVIPFYNFLGLKFDQNSMLIPLWALTQKIYRRRLFDGNSSPFIGGLPAAPARLRILSAFGSFARAARWLK